MTDKVSKPKEQKKKHHFPNTHFGNNHSENPPDWRNVLRNEKHKDDDEELERTPDDVVGMLGFDPKEKDEKH